MGAYGLPTALRATVGPDGASDPGAAEGAGEDAAASAPHFAFIAEVIREAAPYGGDGSDEAFKAAMAARFAYKLKQTNPNFDRSRFMAACGVEE